MLKAILTNRIFILKLVMTALLTVLLPGTHGAQKFRPEKYKKAILYFGHGGGFTGIVNTYALMENGRLFSQKSLSDKTFTQVTKLGRNQTAQIFSNYFFLGIPAIQLEDPGNIYKFVEYTRRQDRHRLTWGGKIPVPDNLTLFYSNLISLIPTTQSKDL